MERSKDEVSAGGDVRKHRLGEELAPGFCTLVLLEPSSSCWRFQKLLYTQGGLLGVFLVYFIRHCYSWYIGYIFRDFCCIDVDVDLRVAEQSFF